MDKNLRIIIAEDDPVHQTILRLILRRLGIKAKAAANGGEVILALEKQYYEMVLMDIQMPEMDGIEATRIIRERWSHGPKIIVVTDCEPDSYRDICVNAGANDFLTKAVFLEDLSAAIERNEAKGDCYARRHCIQEGLA